MTAFIGRIKAFGLGITYKDLKLGVVAALTALAASLGITYKDLKLYTIFYLLKKDSGLGITYKDLKLEWEIILLGHVG